MTTAAQILRKIQALGTDDEGDIIIPGYQSPYNNLVAEINVFSEWNYNMEEAPKDRPILGDCRNHQCLCDSTSNLCLYHAHADGLSHVSDGPHVLVWGGSWDDGGDCWLPDWWFRFDSEFEVAANPVRWMEIPQ